MKAILHIGTGKTGTKSLQAFLRANARALLDQGAVYPQIGRADNHWMLAAAMLDQDRTEHALIRRPRLVDPDNRNKISTEWFDSFRAQVEQHSDRSACILSSEFLCSLRLGEIRRLKARLDPHFDRYGIVIYLRDPADYLVSMHDTALKAGSQYSEPGMPLTGGPTDYAEILRAWLDVFGRDQVHVRLYEKGALVGGDVIDDFATLAGIAVGDMRRPPNLNRSLDLNGQAILTALNRRHATRVSTTRATDKRDFLIGLLERDHSHGQRLAPTAEQRSACDTVLAASNEWVRREFFASRPRLFSSPEVTATDDKLIAADPDLIQAEVNRIEALWLRKRDGRPARPTGRIKLISARVAERLRRFIR